MENDGNQWGKSIGIVTITMIMIMIMIMIMKFR